MTRTALFAFPVTLFAAWYVHVVNRAGNGPGLRWNRIPDNAAFTASLTGVAYFAFVLIALVVLYFTRIRGQPVSAAGLVGPAVLRLAATYVAALVLGVALAEWYCLIDERAFRRETLEHLAAAVPDSVTHELPLYSRARWWPGDAQLLVSPLPGER